ncbi:tryptophan-rich sensory protein, partial [Clostridioides difficile]|uniref:tryptophan-rich sensory protein n=1 Tax=Clostridioides difficile TaxID=1496 RepID=UPI00295EE3B5
MYFVFNLMIWSILFFGFGLRFTALIDIIIMILVSIIMISKFSKIDKRSGY